MSVFLLILIKAAYIKACSLWVCNFRTKASMNEESFKEKK